MDFDSVPPPPHPQGSRGRRRAATLLAALAVMVGLVAMHAAPGGTIGAPMDSMAMNSVGAVVVGAADEVGPPAGTPRTANTTEFLAGTEMRDCARGADMSAGTADRECGVAMSSMTCPLGPAPSPTLPAAASLVLSFAMSRTNVTVETCTHAVPTRAPDLIHLSISRT